MKSFGLALFLSLAIHGLIAACFVFYFDYASVPDELAQLDLTSVELSVAETPDEAVALAAAAQKNFAQKMTFPKPEEPPTPPQETQKSEPAMPQPDATDLPKPVEPRKQFEEKSSVQPSISNLQPAAAPHQAKVDAPPKPCRNIRPDYPRESRLRGEQGNVTLEIEVNAQGTVDDVRVVKSSGYPLLDEAAVNATRTARFSPATFDGKPVPSAIRLPLNFKLK